MIKIKIIKLIEILIAEIFSLLASFVLASWTKFLKRTNKKNMQNLSLATFHFSVYVDCQFMQNSETKFIKTFCFVFSNLFLYV